MMLKDGPKHDRAVPEAGAPKLTGTPALSRHHWLERRLPGTAQPDASKMALGF